MTFVKQVRAAIEMAKTSGISPTMERMLNFAHARIHDRRRRIQFRRLRLQEPLVRDILGCQMKLDPSHRGLDRDLLLDGIREPIATGYIMRMLNSNDVVLEVGANLGYYALIEARMCQKVYAVEPHPGNYQRLEEKRCIK
ncbi:hypothetical protein QW131_18295 [Roseibium salinum]|nr:hypothetical protein [Roseibium salinum]